MNAATTSTGTATATVTTVAASSCSHSPAPAGDDPGGQRQEQRDQLGDRVREDAQQQQAGRDPRKSDTPARVRPIR